MLIRVITRSINYSSALLGSLELSLVTDLMLPFSTPLNNKTKQKAFCCCCEEEGRSANMTGAQEGGSQGEDLTPLGCGTKGSLFWESGLPSWGSPLPPHVGGLESDLVWTGGRKSAGTGKLEEKRICSPMVFGCSVCSCQWESLFHFTGCVFKLDR